MKGRLRQPHNLSVVGTALRNSCIAAHKFVLRNSDFSEIEVNRLKLICEGKARIEDCKKLGLDRKRLACRSHMICTKKIFRTSSDWGRSFMICA